MAHLKRGDTNSLRTFLYWSPERSPAPRVVHSRHHGEYVVVGRNYLAWRAAALLKLAQSIRDPNVAGALVEKAADLKSQLDQSNLPDLGPQAPDVEFQRSHPGDGPEFLPESPPRSR